MAWIDQHCHLPTEANEAKDLVNEARHAGVERLVSVGTGVQHSQAAHSLAERFEGVWSTAGVHPHDAKDGIDGLEELMSLPKVVAVGECGLDFHYDHSPRRTQADMFARQVHIANRQNMPLMIHTRSAWAETFNVLDQEGVPDRVVFHCFSGGVDELVECLDRGGLISFSGIITFPKVEGLLAAVTACPLERLMVETDTPYLAPVPHRGKPNRPALLPFVGAAVAKAKSLDVGEVESTVWHTAADFYSLNVQ